MKADGSSTIVFVSLSLLLVSTLIRFLVNAMYLKLVKLCLLFIFNVYVISQLSSFYWWLLSTCSSVLVIFRHPFLYPLTQSMNHALWQVAHNCFISFFRGSDCSLFLRSFIFLRHFENPNGKINECKLYIFKYFIDYIKIL